MGLRYSKQKIKKLLRTLWACAHNEATNHEFYEVFFFQYGIAASGYKLAVIFSTCTDIDCDLKRLQVFELCGTVRCNLGRCHT